MSDILKLINSIAHRVDVDGDIDAQIAQKEGDMDKLSDQASKKNLSNEEIIYLRETIKKLLPQAKDYFWEIEQLGMSLLKVGGDTEMDIANRILATKVSNFEGLQTILHEVKNR